MHNYVESSLVTKIHSTENIKKKTKTGRNAIVTRSLLPHVIKKIV